MTHSCNLMALAGVVVQPKAIHSLFRLNHSVDAFVRIYH